MNDAELLKKKREKPKRVNDDEKPIKDISKSKNKPEDVSFEVSKILQMFSSVQCPICKEFHPKYFIVSVRGILGCLRCQFDRCWDFMEQNRRTIEVRK